MTTFRLSMAHLFGTRRQYADVRPMRLLLYPGEVHRVSAPYASLRVFSGVAHVTHAGRDIVLRVGDRLSVEAGDIAVVSALKSDPLVIMATP